MQFPFRASRAPRATVPAVALALAATSLAPSAQLGQRFFVSTTNNVAPQGPAPAFNDADVIHVRAGDVPHAELQDGHWLASLGLVPGDVDGLARRPGTVPGSHGALAFSLLSNEGGFLDGDVLGIAAGGGLEVVVPEDAIATALGAPGANLDLDAIAWDDQARLHLSLRSDLAGTSLGTIQDGDVVRLENGGGSTLVLSEQDVAAKLLAATGVTSTIGDVIGMTFVGGELALAVQSPSAYDGAVLGAGSNPAVLLAEEDAGLGGAEVDALLAVGDADLLPRISFATAAAGAGDPVTVSLQGTPGALQVVLYAGGSGYAAFPAAAGWGAWFLDGTDPWLATIFTQGFPSVVGLDPSGSFTKTIQIPAGVSGVGLGGEAGWSFQVLDGGSLTLSAPFRIAST